ncbi:hypothetical protein R5R35_013996 [Gryllus longicercus]|uniref:TLDc domain-containing protein n=1 Tax=Gryllus longicercus TaxID=2509291 RepID=A0AAN9ZEB3_9ORTH
MGHKHSHVGEPTSDHATRRSISDRPLATSRMPQIEGLVKILTKKTLGEKSASGIAAEIFAKYVFPPYQDLGERLFMYFAHLIHSEHENILSAKNFAVAMENFFTSQIQDELQLDVYLKLYGESDWMNITPTGFRKLMLIAYTIAVDHYSGGPASCKYYSRTINAVVDAVFHHKTSLSQSYVSQWILQNCPRLTYGLHRYVLHTLSTSYRREGEESSGLEASTPVLDEEPDFSSDDILLPLSEVWLLAVSLPELYTRPSSSPTRATPNGLSPQSVIAKMMGSVCPSHWTLLYRSSEDGLGSNRFNHHVLHYRGPTVMVINCENDMQYCIASSMEWRETHQYWGDHNCVLLQILPEFHRLAGGEPKLLYFNESIRGYPVGIRVGPAPQRPILEVNADFTHVIHQGAPYSLIELQVWGCGSEQLREAQLDVKRLQIKDAEKARKVKINPEDWVDNPDRYLLELAGHPTFARENPRHSSMEEGSSRNQGQRHS